MSVKSFIDKNEVLRYLGHKGQEYDKALDELIENSIDEVENKTTPKKIFETYDIERQEDGIYLKGTNLVLQGDDIKSCLENCDRVVLMAVTLGNEIERIIKLNERTNMTKAVIVDSIGTAFVEAICDDIENAIYNNYRAEGKSLSFRYSPGYGDLPLEIQARFLDTLNARRRIGLNITESNILIPRKSVTAILGIKSEVKEKIKRTCENCANYSTCTFRKDGISCGA